MNNLKETDFFIVYNNYNNYDFARELNVLYLPLIGPTPIKLYEYLFYKLANEDNMTDKILHFDITDNLAINIKQLLFARRQLEALGLIKSYYYEDETDQNRYVYEILKPLSFSEFLSNSLLSELLKNKIGDINFSTIIKKYPTTKLSFSLFTDVSAKFSDIYDTQETFTKIDSVENNGPNLSEYYFDFNKLNRILSNKFIDIILENSSLRSEILNLAHLYKVNADDMAKGIENSLDRTSAGSEIDIKLLKDYLSQLYINVKQQELPNLDNMINKQILKETYSEKKELTREEKFARELDNINYIDLLKRRHSIIISETANRTVLAIQEKYNFPSGVLNVLLDYCIKHSNSQGFPPYNYIDTIASSWTSKKFKNALEAIEYQKNESKNRKQKTIQKNKNNISYNGYAKKRRHVETPEYIQSQLEELTNKSAKKDRKEDIETDFDQFLKERGIE
ncbi:MAG: DnaD domain protein [Gemella sp.]|nr:DnaD domain protein [Gemella sp.]